MLADPVIRERGARWYCLQTEPRGELVVIHDLLTRGFDVHFPMFLNAVGGRARAMFPGYVFVLFDVSDAAWRSVPYTPRVVRLFSASAECPTPLPVGVVEGFIRAAGMDGVIDATPQPIGPGDEVRITAGAFADHVGLCQRGDGERVTVLLSLFGREVQVGVGRGRVKLRDV